MINYVYGWGSRDRVEDVCVLVRKVEFIYRVLFFWSGRIRYLRVVLEDFIVLKEYKLIFRVVLRLRKSFDVVVFCK